MRSWLLTLAALLLGAAAAPAEGWAEKMFRDENGKLILSHDFGTIAHGTQLKHSFKISNIYAVRMEITSIKTSCGCVTANAAKRILQPRETTTLDISVDGRRFTGSKNFTIRVTVGPEYISTAEIKLTANSRRDVVFNPGEVNFGTVARGSSPTQSIDVEYAGRLPWQITEVITKGVPYTATVKEIYRRAGQVGYRLAVKLKSDAPAGVLKHNLYLKTNDQASPLVPVLVEANVQSSLTVTPAAISLGPVSANAPLIRRVVVRGNKPFTITGVGGTGNGIDLGAALNPRAAETQVVTFKCAFNQAGAFRRELQIRTSLQDTPVTVIIDGSVGQ